MAQAQNGRRVTKAANFFELVRDIQNRRAFARQFAERLEQDINFLRGQDGGWLVHDQQFGILQQTADDLDPLAFSC